MVLIIEVRAVKAEEALGQVLISLKYAFLRNGESQPVYGICTDGSNYIFVKLDNNQVRSNRIDVIQYIDDEKNLLADLLDNEIQIQLQAEE